MTTFMASNNAATMSIQVGMATPHDSFVDIPLTSINAIPRVASLPDSLVEIPVKISSNPLAAINSTPKKSKNRANNNNYGVKSSNSTSKRSKRNANTDNSGSKTSISAPKRCKRTVTNHKPGAKTSTPTSWSIVCGIGCVHAIPVNTYKKRKRIADLEKTPNSSMISAQDENVIGTRSRMSLGKRAQVRNCCGVDADGDDDNDSDDVNDNDNYVAHYLDSESDDNVVQHIDFEPEMRLSTEVANDGSVESLVASWKRGIRGVGQDFENVNAFREALQKYAIARRFGYKLKKNESNRATGVCVVQGCSWKIHASWVPSESVFRIKKFNKSHTCGGESWKSAHPKKNWLVSIIKERLKENPNQKTKNIANRILQDFDLELSYCTIRRGIDEAREGLHGSFKEAYKHLPHFVDKIVEANPGTFAELVIGDDRKFQHLFLSFHACINGFQNGCRPLIFLDANSFKSKYHEVLLTASALDGDDAVLPVALAVVDIETDETWRWFLDQLKSAIPNSRSLTFVSDREKGLTKSVLETFENAHHGYSIHYLMEDFMRNLRGPFQGDGKPSLPPNFLAAARADRIDGFKVFTEQIKRVSPKAYDWVMQIEPKNWSSALFPGEPYSHITSDVGEIYSKWIEETHEMCIIQKLEAVVGKIVELVNYRQDNSKEWSGILVPSKEEKLQEECNKASVLKVFISSDTVFEVHDGSVQVVDINKRNCSCFGWKPTGLPCRHAIAVLNRIDRNLYDYCSKYFSVESYCRTYSETINPFSYVMDRLNEEEGNEEEEEERVLPPPFSRTSGLEKRMQDRKRGRSVCCTKCGGIGHNKATCKESLPPVLI